MIISLTQHLPPNGERRDHYVEVPDAQGRQEKYNELMEAGCTITGEVLMNMQISTCISCEEAEDDFVIHLTAHPFNGGPTGPEAAGQAIDRWDRAKFLRWKERVSQ